MTINRKTTSSEKVTTSPLPTMGGLRLTRQRQEVYQTLLEQRDHPTAGEVYLRVRNKMPSISLATVYNCLDALVVHKLVKQVNFDREPSR
ncbi:MAG: transcriptional repressor, partial [Akkermansia sp.]